MLNINTTELAEGNSPGRKFTLTFDALPTTLEEFKALPQASLSKPEYASALFIVAMTQYKKNREEVYKMIDVLKGPAPLSPMDKNWLNDRMMDKGEWLLYSYFAGATPANEYTPAKPFSLTFADEPYSYKDETSRKLFIKSAGADSPRPVITRLKPSTGQWFITDYAGIMLSIVVPDSQDPWK